MSGAAMIAGCLSQRGGVPCLTREDLLAVVNSYGGLATRIAEQIRSADHAYEQFSDIRRPYLILMRRALLEYARKGGLAYFGYSGHLLVPKIAHFVRVRLIAPLEVRLARTRRSMGLGTPEAKEYLRSLDAERARWARMMYGVDIRDPGEYDICINLERLSLHGACDLLVKAREQTDFQPTPESLAHVENEYLATQVLAALATNPETLSAEVGATATDGSVRLVGPYLPADSLRTVLAAAHSIPGVREVEYEPGYAPAFSHAS
jgi:Cytidylate kinase-like family